MGGSGPGGPALFLVAQSLIFLLFKKEIMTRGQALEGKGLRSSQDAQNPPSCQLPKPITTSKPVF